MFDINPIIEEIRADALKENVPVVTPEVASILSFLIKFNKPKNVLELGMGYGVSALSMLAQLNEESNFVSVDSSINSYNYTLNRVNGFNNCNLIHSEAIKFLKNYKGNKFDFVFIDAVKKEYKSYLELLIDITTDDVLMVFDNVLWRGKVFEENPKGKAEHLKDFICYINGNKALSNSIVNVSDGLGLVWKK